MLQKIYQRILKKYVTVSTRVAAQLFSFQLCFTGINYILNLYSSRNVILNVHNITVFTVFLTL